MAGTKFDFLKEARHIMLDPRLASWIFKVAEAYDKNPIEIVEIYREFLDSAFSDRWWINLEKEDIEQIKRIRKHFQGVKPSVEEYLRYKTQEYDNYLAMLEAARLAEQEAAENEDSQDCGQEEIEKEPWQEAGEDLGTPNQPPIESDGVEEASDEEEEEEEFLEDDLEDETDSSTACSPEEARSLEAQTIEEDALVMDGEGPVSSQKAPLEKQDTGEE